MSQGECEGQTTNLVYLIEESALKNTSEVVQLHEREPDCVILNREPMKGTIGMRIFILRLYCLLYFDFLDVP